jgi:hypothetical protein
MQSRAWFILAGHADIALADVLGTRLEIDGARITEPSSRMSA